MFSVSYLGLLVKQWYRFFLKKKMSYHDVAHLLEPLFKEGLKSFEDFLSLKETETIFKYSTKSSTVAQHPSTHKNTPKLNEKYRMKMMKWKDVSYLCSCSVSSSNTSYDWRHSVSFLVRTRSASSGGSSLIGGVIPYHFAMSSNNGTWLLLGLFKKGRLHKCTSHGTVSTQKVETYQKTPW